MRIPGVEAGEITAPVSLLDVTPTLVDLLGLAPDEPDDFRGRSLVPRLIRRPAGSPPHVYSQYFLEERLWTDEDPLVMASVFTDSRHLVIDRRSGRKELYAWRSDPLERHDLTSTEGDVARELSDELAAFVRAVHTPPGAGEAEDAGGDEDPDAGIAAQSGDADASSSAGGASGSREESPASARPAPRGPVPPAAMPGALHDAGVPP
ncbi:MAG: hypothetical protein GXP55_04800 [Deltaproteobacteria bacterium]|nr:hypothetical protein [Deltaproteobacteria bacterium]